MATHAKNLEHKVKDAQQQGTSQQVSSLQRDLMRFENLRKLISAFKDLGDAKRYKPAKQVAFNEAYQTCWNDITLQSNMPVDIIERYLRLAVPRLVQEGKLGELTELVDTNVLNSRCGNIAQVRGHLKSAVALTVCLTNHGTFA